MKRCSKLFAIVLALTLIFAAAPAAFAAGTEPGKTVSVSFTFEDIYGVDGTFTFSNDSILTNITYSDSGNMAGKINNNIAYYYNSESTDFTITVSAKVVSSAENGDKCDITFTYRTSDANGNMTDWKTETKTVNVEIHTCGDKNKDHKCDVCGTKLSSCEDANKDHKCDLCGATVSSCVDSNYDLKCDICGKDVEAPIDYTELDRQIEIAEGLQENGYTADSWSDLVEALENAKEVRENGAQGDVDNAAEELEEAINKLVKVDYSKLIEALEKSEEIGNETVSALIERLIAAIEGANSALESNDQATVDTATAELEAVIAELEKALDDMKEVQTETVEKEVIVEVEPTTPFCNIFWHNILLILLVVSLIANAVLAIILVVNKKKENTF